MQVSPELQFTRETGLIVLMGTMLFLPLPQPVGITVALFQKAWAFLSNRRCANRWTYKGMEFNGVCANPDNDIRGSWWVLEHPSAWSHGVLGAAPALVVRYWELM